MRRAVARVVNQLFLVLLWSTVSFAAAPTITSLSPTSGGIGATVTITGSNFGSTRGTSTVKFNGTTSTPSTWSATSIKVPVPAGATTGNVVVTVSGVASNGKAFTVLPTPTISSLSPTSGSPGDPVTITGTNFGAAQGTSSVKFNGTAATPTGWSDTSILVPVPSAATTGNVVVTVSGVASAGASFTVAPNISSLSPTSGAVGASVTISGKNFQSTQGNNTVTFNGTVAAPTNWTNTQITVPLPGGASTGPVVVTAAGLTSNSKTFTVKPTPTISSVSPNFGAAGISITISGTNFGSTQGTSTVSFNGTAATPTSWSASQIMVPVPTGSTTGNLIVHTSSVDVSGGNFTVETVASISLSPQPASLPVKSLQQFSAIATYTDGNKQDVESYASWTTSDPNIANVSTSGSFNAVAQGSVTVQAIFAGLTASASLNISGPTFWPVGSLITPRISHTATLLQSGKVLIAGGEDQNNNVLASAELYDPSTGLFTLTGSMGDARMDHTATLLPDGTVLITGGYSSANGGESLFSAELYDPATGTFSGAANMVYPHFAHAATLLNDGTVLISGGHYLIPGGGGGDSISEIYDPATGTFAATTGNLLTPRTGHTATLLNDGTVLIAGGSDSYSLAAAEIYDPATGSFTATGSLNIPSSSTATLLNDGRVLIAGGSDDSPSGVSDLKRAELYDPATKIFTLTSSLNTERAGLAASALQDGSVLVVGGQNSSGTNNTTADLFNPATETFTGAGAMAFARSGPSATLLNDGTVLIAGGENLSLVARAEIYSSVPPPPRSLRISPSTVNMLVGDSRQFTAVDDLGNPRPDVAWTISDTSVASLPADGSPNVTALAAGSVTLTATVGAVSGQAQITISAATALAPGTVLWSNPPAPGFFPIQLVQAVPANGSPDLYSIQTSADSTQTTVQALTADGQQIWQMQLPEVNGNGVPDGSGGLIVTEHETCLPGQTDPMTIVDLDGATGQAKWQLAAAGIDNGNGTLVYCYPDDVKALEPQIAIRGDGAIVVAAMTNNGLPPLTINGSSWPIPSSTSTDPSGGQIADFSPMGPPIVDSDDSIYLEYEVRNIAYPPRITSAILYLLKIASNNTSTAITLSSTTADENLMPGRIIPDGNGGVLATWTISPSDGSVPPHPYQASHVVGGVPGPAYDLPFAPKTAPPVGTYPTMVLGENGIAFATDGTNSDPSDPNDGPQIVSFDLNSGAPNWSYQLGSQDQLTIIASTAGNGLTAKVTDSGADSVIRFDPAGTPLSDSWSGNQIDYYMGDLWVGNAPSSAAAAFTAEPIIEAAAPGTRPKGDPQHNGTTDPGLLLVATQDCHKANVDKTLYARYPIYSLRLPSDKSKTPSQSYTVFEFIPQNPTGCGVGGFNDLNPCKFADGSAQFPYNEFDDEISTGLAGGSMNRAQYFLYGLPNQRLFGVKQIDRMLSDGSLQPKAGKNQLTARPGSDPLIDGQPDPWLAPWDGTFDSCDSSFSVYFP